MTTIKTLAIILTLMIAGFGGQGEKNAKTTDVRTLKKADVIYNQIMFTVTPEFKARIDSSRTGSRATGSPAVTNDSASAQKELAAKNRAAQEKYLQSLPDDVRLRVENAINDMEQRQLERALEFKEMKKGR